jgi:FMN phosphatase YigB (HAD superfamily)
MRDALIQEIEGTVLREGLVAVTVDVFDTVLLRNTKPERLRFAQVARRQAKRLECPWRSVFAARLLCARIAYQTAPYVAGERDGRIDDIFRLMLEALQRPAERLAVLRQEELQYEKLNLRLNRPLLALLGRLRSAGVRLYYLSDMYLTTADVDSLLAHAAPEWRFDGGYVSSDHGVTKRGGGLYRRFLHDTGLSPMAVLHLGDSGDSDVRAARQAGMRAVHTPRNRIFETSKVLRELFIHEC